MPTTGERLLTTPILRDGRVQLTTTAINASLSTGENWLREPDYLTGGPPSKTILDINEDGYLNDSDSVDSDGDGSVEDTAATVYDDTAVTGLRDKFSGLLCKGL